MGKEVSTQNEFVGRLDVTSKLDEVIENAVFYIYVL